MAWFRRTPAVVAIGPAETKQREQGRAASKGGQLDTEIDDHLSALIWAFRSTHPGHNRPLMRKMRWAVPVWDACIKKLVGLLGWVEFEAATDRILDTINDFQWKVPVNSKIADSENYLCRGLKNYVSQHVDSFLEQGISFGERIVGAAGKGGIVQLQVADPLTLRIEASESEKGAIVLYQQRQHELKAVRLPSPDLIDVVGMDWRHGSPYAYPLGYGLVNQVPPFLAICNANLSRARRDVAPSRILAIETAPDVSPKDCQVAADKGHDALQKIGAAEIRGKVADQVIAAPGKITVTSLGGTGNITDPDKLVELHLKQFLAKAGLSAWVVGLGPFGTTERLSSNERQIIEQSIKAIRSVAEILIDRVVQQHLDLIGQGQAEWTYTWHEVTLGGEEERASAARNIASAEFMRTEAVLKRFEMGLLTPDEANERFARMEEDLGVAREGSVFTPRIRTKRSVRKTSAIAPKVVELRPAESKALNTRIEMRRRLETSEAMRKLMPVMDEFMQRLVNRLRLRERESIGKAWYSPSTAEKIAAFLAEQKAKYRENRPLFPGSAFAPLPELEKRAIPEAAGLSKTDREAIEDVLSWLETQFIGRTGEIAGESSLATQIGVQSVTAGIEEGQLVLRLLGRGGTRTIRVYPNFEYVVPIRRFALKWVKDNFIWDNRIKVLEVLEAAIREGLHPFGVAEKLHQEIGPGAYWRWRWERLARTEIAAGLDAGMVAGWELDGVPYERWEAAANCCELCGSLAGKVWRLGEGPHVAYDTHPNCRCTREPFFHKPRALQEIPWKHGVPWKEQWVARQPA